MPHPPLIESCEAAGDLIKRLVDCLTAIADCQGGPANPRVATSSTALAAITSGLFRKTMCK